MVLAAVNISHGVLMVSFLVYLARANNAPRIDAHLAGRSRFKQDQNAMAYATCLLLPVAGICNAMLQTHRWNGLAFIAGRIPYESS